MPTRVVRVKFDPGNSAASISGFKRGLDSIDQSSKSVAGALRTLKTAVSGIIAALGLRSVVQYADAWTLANNRIRLVTDSTEELNTVQRELLNIANETRTAYGSVVELYGRVARSSKELNLSQRELLDVTETINQAIQVSGATSTEAAAGVVQFAQGLASGALRGDELRSVLEQMPRLARALADGLGVTIGQLRELGQEGKLTTEQVIGALQQQAPQIRAEFEQLTPTIAQAFEVVQTQVGAFIGILDSAGGTSASVAAEIIGLANDLDELARALTGTLEKGDELTDTEKQLAIATVVVGTSLVTLGRIVFEAVAIPFKQAGDQIGALAAALVQLSQGNFSGAFEIVKGRVESITGALDGLGDAFDRSVLGATDTAEKIAEILDPSKRTAQTPDTDLTTRSGAARIVQVADENEKAKKAIDAMIESLREQNETFGLSAGAIAEYKLAALGANEATQALGRQLAEDLEVLEASAEAAKEQAAALAQRADELENNRQADEGFLQALRDQVRLVGASRQELAEYEAIQRLSADATDEQRQRALALVSELEAATVAQEELALATAAYEAAAADIAHVTVDAFRDIASDVDNAGEAINRFADRLQQLILEIAVFEPLEGFLRGGLTDLFSGTGGLSGLIPSFASGADFIVGGRGGVDTNVVAFNATKGERVQVTPQGESSGGNTTVIFNGISDMDSFRRSRSQIQRTIGEAVEAERSRTA